MEVLNPGQMFAGRYRVLRRLAEGGMGAVYVAQQEATELEVALKVLWPHILQRKEAMERFALEAKISARIRSDHIVQVFDAGFDQETNMPFLVMELLRGATLQSLVEQRGPLPPAEAVELIVQTARGLDRAHAYQDAEGRPAPVIHRDLKPDNLFVVRRETGEALVKILDYGIAKILSQSTSLSREIKGTPLYMAYEQAVGKPLSPQTDLWALGLIAYFALTGENYWRSAHSQDSELHTLITEIVAMPLTPASERHAEHSTRGALLPPTFDPWFQRCVNREPGERFTSAGEAAQKLVELFQAATPAGLGRSNAFDVTMMPSDPANQLRPGQSSPSIQTPPGQTQAGAGTTGGGAQTASSGGSTSLTAGGSTIEPASVTQPAPGRKSSLPWVAAALGVATVGALILSQMKSSSEGPSAAAQAEPSPPPVAVSPKPAPAPAPVAPLVAPTAAPSAEPTAAATAAPSAALATIASTAKPATKPAAKPVAARPATKTPVVATKTPTAVKPATTTPATTTPATTTTAAPARPKEKFDPLAGPRVH